jgi:hypothetical protein
VEYISIGEYLILSETALRKALATKNDGKVHIGEDLE